MEGLKDFYHKIDKWLEKGYISKKSLEVLKDFLAQYIRTVTNSGTSHEFAMSISAQYLDVLEKLFIKPFHFMPYHKMITEPFDYYTFGMDFAKPLIKLNESQYFGEENLQNIEKQIKAKENVIFLANHQTEIDPHLINHLLKEKHAALGKDMIYVAGDRVISDHLAIPMSMGRNLLCIYSKKHINNPPEKKEAKRLHNKKTMQLMSELLSEGGKCIYVAPSGGRDRPDKNGVFNVASFDAQSIEMFYLMTKRAKTVTHFYPLALLTYRVLPPPNDVESELGEKRHTECAGVYVSFGKVIDMENFPGCDHQNKMNQRHLKCDHIWNIVKDDYQKLIKIKDQHEESN